MWLQKDEYDNSHPGRPLGVVCTYPVHSLKQRKVLESTTANYSRNAVKQAPVYEICVSKCSTTKVAADNANRNNVDNNVVVDQSDSNCRSVINCVDKEAETGNSVRSILNILDSFRLEDMKEDNKSTVVVSPVKTGITVVESNLLDGQVDPNANAKPEPLREENKNKVSVFNEECLINGMSQGDRLQQIKSLRRHARATTTGALK